MDNKRVHISGGYIIVKIPSELTGGKDKRRCFSLSQKVGKAFKRLLPNIAGQVDKQYNKRDTKNRRSRKAYLLREGREWLKTWLSIREAEKERLRHLNHAPKLRKACKQTFDNPENTSNSRT